MNLTAIFEASNAIIALQLRELHQSNTVHKSKEVNISLVSLPFTSL